MLSDEAISHLSGDPVLKAILANHGHPIVQKRTEGFAAMCHIILEQQVSIASAKACYVKLEKALGAIKPQTVAEAGEELFRSCGVSRQKTIYLKDLASKIISGIIDFASFASKHEHQVREELLAIKGVGNWSVEVYLMFCLQLPDVIPLGDIAVRNTMMELFSCTTVEQMSAIAENWKPYRSMATFILWHHYLKKRNKI